ncbi:DUF6270 domain-containing protein [Rothia sp. ARF10]|nr:DUF6270 domain-containing protein [Rothia sp. ARF10]
MPAPTDRPVRVLVYGSCVGRDTMEFARSGSVDLRAYVARQSVVSVGSDASRHLPEVLSTTSKFQESMIRGDFAGSFGGRLEELAPRVEVLLWDLTDERHGIHRFDDGSVVTRSIDNTQLPELREVLDGAEHIPLGSPEHVALWDAAVDRFEARLRALDLFDRTVVLRVPWALRTTEGKASPWSMGMRAKDANALYVGYYERLRERGFAMIEVPQEAVLADPGHRWGLAPFHYTPEVYETILRSLDGVLGSSQTAPIAD